MKEKMIQCTLPEFGFVEGYGDNDELYGREVILHIRSASVMEIFEQGKAFLNEDVLTYTFSRLNHVLEAMTGKECEEKYVMALHSSPLLDVKADRDYILQNIMKPASLWYCDYCRFMDSQISEKDLF